MTRTDAESLPELLGGRRSAIDAALPAVAFVVGWLAADSSIGTGTAAAVLTGAAVAAWRLRQGRQPVSTVLSLLAVCVAAIIVLRTGRAQDFFLVRILTNAASALVWAGSVMLRWPLLGVIVGTLLGQKTRWRRDSALLRAYARASWIWVGQYLLRLVILVPLWWAGQTVLLAAAQLALTWPLVAACIAASWWALRRSLPADHPGLRYPIEPGEPGASGEPGRVSDGSAATPEPPPSAPQWTDGSRTTDARPAADPDRRG